MTWTPIKRRDYLFMRAVETAGIFGALEAVSTTALAHPEWDMDERRTWPEWEQADLANLPASATPGEGS